jgi:GR25 family glycosyltransferase involved in LPS biosynthesis
MNRCQRNRNIVIFVLIVLCFLLFSGILVTEKYTAYKDILENPYRRVIQRIIPNQVVKTDKPIMATGDIPLTHFEKTKYNYLLIDMEPVTNVYNYDPYAFVLTTKKSQITHPERQLYVPNWSLAIGESNEWTIPDLLQPRSGQINPYFCAYLPSQCRADEIPRAEQIFYEKLHSRKTVTVLSCTERQFTPYKFVMIFDPIVPGYVSEKIVLSLLAGAVPIYSGDSSVKDMFNPGCYIYTSDFSSVESCVNYVMYVDSNPGLYETYIRTPIIQPQRLVEYAGWYYGTQAFYNPLFNVFPHLRRQAYVPIRDRDYRSDPSKPIKIVNLDQSKDRWENMQRQIQANPNLKDKYERFPAVRGKHYYNEYKPYLSTKHYTLNPGEMGIYLSTMELCKCLVDDPQNEYYVLLEDDLVISRNILSVDTYISRIPSDWDILFLGYSDYYCKQDKHIHEPFNQTYVKMQTDCMPCNHAVVVRKRAAQYLLNFAFPMEYPIDVLYQLHCENLNIYLIHPRVFVVASGLPSTIQVAESI